MLKCSDRSETVGNWWGWGAGRREAGDRDLVAGWKQKLGQNRGSYLSPPVGTLLATSFKTIKLNANFNYVSRSIFEKASAPKEILIVIATFDIMRNQSEVTYLPTFRLI